MGDDYHSLGLCLVINFSVIDLHASLYFQSQLKDLYGHKILFVSIRVTLAWPGVAIYCWGGTPVTEVMDEADWPGWEEPRVKGAEPPAPPAN